MPMMQGPGGQMIRLPYPGEPGGPPMGGAPMGAAPMGGAPMAGSMPGTGYDQYLPMIRERMMAPPMRIRMPRPVPRFPTPGRMDGMRLAKRKPGYEMYEGPGGMGLERNIQVMR